MRAGTGSLADRRCSLRRGRRHRCGCGHSSGSRLGRHDGLGGWGRRGSRRPGGGRGPDDAQGLADLRGLVLRDADLQQHPGARRRQLGVDLVGRDLEQGLVGRHHVADLLQPAGDGALGHGLAQGGQDHRGLRAGHGLAPGARGVGVRGERPEGRRSGGGGGRHSRAGRGSGNGRDGSRSGDGSRHRGRGGRGSSRLLWCRRGRGSRSRGSLAGCADHAERRTDRDRLVLTGGDGQQHPGRGRRDLGVDLVGRDLDQGLVRAHLVADLLEPAGDGALGDALAELRHGDGDRHLRDS